MRKTFLNPWQRANYDLHQLFEDGRLRVEKPAAIMDDTGRKYSFYYSLVSIRPV